jgi:methylated-DNA-[protein]-cysteine S-methyltransferase
MLILVELNLFIVMSTTISINELYPAKAYLETPIGWMEIQGSQTGITRVRKVEKAEQESAELPSHVQTCKQQLAEYFRRERSAFELPLDFGDATSFHQEVWQTLLAIPYGHTTNYSQIAEKLGDANKVRAVGQANRHNPIAIIVPCHRVVAKNGDLHGYFYGLEVKRKLLEIENPMSFAEQGSLF